MRPAGPVLLYRQGCAKCRLLSRLAVVASLGQVARRPLSSIQDAATTHRLAAARGKLALLDGERLVLGWRVVPSVLCRPLVRLVRHVRL